MNKHDYWKLPNRCTTFEYRYIHKLLEQWKITNNISESCVVHHRDDTEECCKYNEEHYERWGLNEDGAFEYGKYVVFMTKSAHSAHHAKGENNPMYGTKSPMYGKKHTDCAKEKISNALKGENHPLYNKHFSDEHRAKLRVAQQAHLASVKFLYSVYKNNGGQKKWNQFQRALRTGEITFEMLPNTIYTNEVHNES